MSNSDDKVVNFPNSSIPPVAQDVYPYGSGSGGDGDMPGRVKRLEDDVKSIKDTLQRMEPTLARIDERLKHIPSTWIFIVTVVASVLAALTIK